MLCAWAAAILHTGWRGLVFYPSLLHWLAPWLWMHHVSCSCLLSQWIVQDRDNQSVYRALWSTHGIMHREVLWGSLFGLFVYSESIWRIILVKPKLLPHRLPETKDISSSRVAVACAPDLPTQASCTLARPLSTLQWILHLQPAPATCTLSNAFSAATVNCRVTQVNEYNCVTQCCVSHCHRLCR